MSLNHCFEPGTVVNPLVSTSKYDALRELIRRAPVFGELGDRGAFEAAVIEREKSQSTGFGHGVAVAHGRVREARRVLVALGLSAAGIPFQSHDGEPVHLLFVIASPPDLSLDYLQALSTLIRCVREPSVRQSLLGSQDEPSLHAMIRHVFATELGRCSIPSSGPPALATTS
ncbi:MAG TPA: PTS sugar transporter subunit IIA [Spirochaetia bacterium]|nr:PTS sugar transporter subunit IIA [Spirochaetia bacterium]